METPISCEQSRAISPENCEGNGDRGMGLEGGGGGDAGRPKVTKYSRSFLLECSDLPKSRKRPSLFPLPDVGCTLSECRDKNYTQMKPAGQAFPPVYVAPRRKEEMGVAGRRDVSDNINLRPNQTGGYPGPPPNRDRSGFFDQRVDRDRDREGHGGFRDRNFRDRDDRGGRYRRDDRDRFNFNRWGDPEGWDRDDQGAQENQGRWGSNSHRNGRGDGRNDVNPLRCIVTYNRDPRDRRPDRRDHGPPEPEQEPEWFSGGPTSRHETMELSGFMDDTRREKTTTEQRQNGELKELSNGDKETQRKLPESPRKTDQGISSAESPPTGMGFNFDKILNMDTIPGIGQEQEQANGLQGSRFTQIFQRNMANQRSSPPMERNGKQANDTKPHDDKKEIVQEMGNALRNMLQITSQQQQQHKTENEEPKPPAVKGRRKIVLGPGPMSMSIDHTSAALPNRDRSTNNEGSGSILQALVSQSNKERSSSSNSNNNNNEASTLQALLNKMILPEQKQQQQREPSPTSFRLPPEAIYSMPSTSVNARPGEMEIPFPPFDPSNPYFGPLPPHPNFPTQFMMRHVTPGPHPPLNVPMGNGGGFWPFPPPRGIPMMMPPNGPQQMPMPHPFPMPPPQQGPSQQPPPQQGHPRGMNFPNQHPDMPPRN